MDSAVAVGDTPDTAVEVAEAVAAEVPEVPGVAACELTIVGIAPGSGLKQLTEAAGGLEVGTTVGRKAARVGRTMGVTAGEGITVA